MLLLQQQTKESKPQREEEEEEEEMAPAAAVVVTEPSSSSDNEESRTSTSPAAGTATAAATCASATSPRSRSSSSVAASSATTIPYLFVCVHKLHARRLVNYVQKKLLRLDHDNAKNDDEECDADGSDDDDSSFFDTKYGVTRWDAQVLTGVSQSRRGYLVVKIPMASSSTKRTNGMMATTTSAMSAPSPPPPSSLLMGLLSSSPIAPPAQIKQHLDALSPLARQNISWVSYVDHQQKLHVRGGTTSSSTDRNGASSSANTIDSSDDSYADIAAQLWNCLVSSHGFKLDGSSDGSAKNDTLRIDVYPASETMRWCLALERHVAKHVLNFTDEQLSQVNEPFVDPNIPLEWTKSRHKCTHRIAIVMETASGSNSQSSSKTVVHWRVESRHHNPNDFYLDVKLNHDAHQQVVVVPDPELEEQEGATGCGADADEPVHTSVDGEQVAQDRVPAPLLPPTIGTSKLKDVEMPGADARAAAASDSLNPPPHAVDLTTKAAKKRGSRRGKKRARMVQQPDGDSGSTAPLSFDLPLSRAYYKLHQVWKEYLSCSRLLSSLLTGHAVDVGASPGGWTQVLLQMGFSHVIAIDPGRVSTRVTSHSAVTHVAKKLEDVEPHELQVESSKSKVSMVVCDACVLWLELLDDVLLKELTAKIERAFQVPCVWVITLKLPFKTVGSIQRHVKAAKDKLPEYVQQLADAMYGPGTATSSTLRITYRLLHLFANSDSERTVLIVFERRDDDLRATN